MNNKHLVECLRTPLYLCMFASSGENTLLPETQGEILYFFFHRNSSFYNIRKRAVETRTNPLNELQTQLVLDFILPYIGACFESEDIFSVNAGNFGHMILKSVEAVRELFLDAGSNPFVDFYYSKLKEILSRPLMLLSVYLITLELSISIRSMKAVTLNE